MLGMAVAAAVASPSWAPATPVEPETSRDHALAWLLIRQAGDGSWRGVAAGTDVQATAAAQEALSRFGIGGFARARSLSWLGNAETHSVDARSRKILALASAGLDASAERAGLLAWRNRDDAWGAYDRYGTSFPDTPLALRALRSDAALYALNSAKVLNAVYCRILPAQKTGDLAVAGSWSYSGPLDQALSSGGASAILPTVYNVLESAALLAEGKDVLSRCGDSYSTSAAMNGGVDWLLRERRNADGGFGPGGESRVLPTALGYLAVARVRPGDAALESARAYLIAQQAADGSWEQDPFVTATVLTTLPEATLPDTDRDGVPDSIELLLGTDPGRNDSGTLVGGNGRGAPGVTAPHVFTATLHAPFHATLTVSGGTPPYQWTTDGALPLGVGLDGATGVVSGTPTSAGVYNFTYTVTDSAAASVVAVAQIVVNTPPVMEPVADQANGEGDIVRLVLGASDGDLDLLTYGASGLPPGIALNPATGVLGGTLSYAAAGAYTVTATVSDGKAQAQAVFGWLVAGANRPPVAVADVALTAEDAPVVIAPLGNDADPDGDPLALSGFTQAAHGVVAGHPDGSLTYTPAANYFGSDAFAYTASDPHGGTSTASVTVTVEPVNDPPTAADDAGATPEDTELQVSPLANDSDVEADTLRVSAVSAPSHGTAAVLPDGVTVVYNPSPDYHGPDSFGYTASDGAGGSAAATIHVTVSPVNDAPVAMADAATLDEDGSITLAPLSNDSDPDGDTLVLGAVGVPSHGTAMVGPDGVTVAYTPSAGYSGPDSFDYTASDGSGGSTTATVSISVAPVNDAPVAAPDTGVTDEDQPLSLSVLLNDSDADGDALGIASVTAPSHGSAAIGAGGLVTYTPAPDFHGADSFEYTIEDASGATGTALVTISVSPVNDPPVLAPIADQHHVEGDAVDLALTATDADGDPLAYQASGLPGGLSLDSATGRVSGVLAAGSAGTHAVVVTVTDGVAVASQSLTWVVSLADVTPPVVTPPPDLTVEASGALTDAPLGAATAVDDVDGSLPASPDRSGPFPLGIHEVHWSATDAAGNTGTAKQIVAVRDTTPPVLTVPGTVTVETDATEPIRADFGQASATDAFEPVTIVNDAPERFAQGTTVVTWTATDPNGNQARASQFVIVIGPDTPRRERHFAERLADADARELATVGDLALFVAADAEHGRELWTTAGAPVDAGLLADILPGSDGSNPRALTPLGGFVFFVADDAAGGAALYRTSGTAQSTISMGAVAPSSRYITLFRGMLFVSSFPVVVAGDHMYYPGSDGAHGVELWRFDGVGVSQVKDIHPGAGSSNPTGLTAFGNVLYFAANDGSSGHELWRTDGTEAGTLRVKDINAGAASSFPSRLAGDGAFVYFAADDGVSGVELWRSDGSEGGTARIADIAPGAASSSPGELAWVDGALYFSADDGVHGRELWKSDGTATGTALVADVSAGRGSSAPAQLVEHAGRVYFVADDGIHGFELWTTDGSRAGTLLVEDAAPGAAAAAPWALSPGASGLYFLATRDAAEAPERSIWVARREARPFVDSDSDELDDLWELQHFQSLDASAPGDADGDEAVNLEESRQGSDPQVADTDADGLADGFEIHNHLDPSRSDAAADFDRDGLTNLEERDAGTVPFVKDTDGDGASDGEEAQAGSDPSSRDDIPAAVAAKVMGGGVAGASPRDLVRLGDRILFSFEDASGRELWSSDGTAAGTARVADILPGPASSNPRALTPIAGFVFFVTDDGAGGAAVWRTSGTASTTYYLGAVPPATRYLSAVRGRLFATSFPVVSTGDYLYYLGNDGVRGTELWRFDGTSSAIVKDIQPGPGSSAPTGLVAIGSRLYFAADDGTTGFEPWTSDGTEAGTRRVKDIQVGASGSFPTQFTGAGAAVYFTASDGATGHELWKTDGSEAGTTLAADIVPGAGSSAPAQLAWADGVLYFSAVDVTHGQELWRSDGTPAGTWLVSDLREGAGSGSPAAIVTVPGRAYFVADDGVHGRELWTSDGTGPGTVLVKDAQPGAGPSSPATLTVAGGRLFFVADDGGSGPELWRTPIP
jgi:ELWxxDGT repeat protein